MTLLGQLASRTAFPLAVLIVANLCASTGWATYTVTLTQQGSNVVAMGNGTIDLAALKFSLSENSTPFIGPSLAAIVTGPSSLEPIDEYTGFTGPKSFGVGLLAASSGTGDAVGIGGFTNQLFVPHGYHSGASLSSSATWDNQTFASLGVTPGSYTWSWGNGPTVDTFTLDATSTVPEPSSFLLLMPAGLFAVLRTRSRMRS